MKTMVHVELSEQDLALILMFLYMAVEDLKSAGESEGIWRVTSLRNQLLREYLSQANQSKQKGERWSKVGPNRVLSFTERRCTNNRVALMPGRSRLE